jgi:hypothetical protein
MGEILGNGQPGQEVRQLEPTGPLETDSRKDVRTNYIIIYFNMVYYAKVR